MRYQCVCSRISQVFGITLSMCLFTHPLASSTHSQCALPTISAFYPQSVRSTHSQCVLPTVSARVLNQRPENGICLTQNRMRNAASMIHTHHQVTFFYYTTLRSLRRLCIDVAQKQPVFWIIDTDKYFIYEILYTDSHQFYRLAPSAEVTDGWTSSRGDLCRSGC